MRQSTDSWGKRLETTEGPRDIKSIDRHVGEVGMTDTQRLDAALAHFGSKPAIAKALGVAPQN